ncbi:MAG: hypothetical protein A2039_08700 [Candidatus Melainabacteria bacterium GWA2_34_9]|nr:MAG: hypothetical protein A2039_08700 [Candidatus Melainabacteria bacterium GWA2_34_9]
MNKILKNKKVLTLLTVVLVIIAACFIYDATRPKDIQFVSTGDLNTARAYHKSTILNNGNILITGGYGLLETEYGPQPKALDSAELYNPKINKFIELINMNLPHEYHSQFLLSNGHVVIMDINGIEIYDPIKNKFSLVNVKIPTRENILNAHTFTQLKDKILIMGGITSDNQHVLDTVEVFDASTRKVYEAGKMTIPRFGHNALAVSPNSILIFGGTTNDKNNKLQTTTSIEKFDIKTGKSSIIGNMLIPREFHKVLILPDNKLLIFGGKTVSYKKRVFQKSKEAPFLIKKTFVTIIPEKTKERDEVEIYDIKTNKSHLIGTEPHLKGECSDNSIIRLNNDNILIIRDKDNVNPSVIKIFNVKQNKFIEVENKYKLRKHSSAILLNNRNIYISGGEKKLSKFEASLENLECKLTRICITALTKETNVLTINKERIKY